MSSGFINPSAGGLLRGNNLSDLANAQTALDNLINNATVTGANFGSSAVNGIRLYNTADQQINWERLEIRWTGNIAYIVVNYNGLGTPRELRIGNVASFWSLKRANSADVPFAKLNVLSGGAIGSHVVFTNDAGVSTASAGQMVFAAITPYYSQSGTSAATDLLVNRTENSIGSGDQNLIDLQVNSVSRFRVDRVGQVLALAGASYLRYGVFPRTGNATLSTSRQLNTNEGAGARVDLTLPPAAAGLSFSFFCHNANGIRIYPAPGNTIRDDTRVTTPGGYVEQLTVGYTLTLVAINSTEWVALNHIGAWTVI